ncbi:hypothetical protein ABE67_21855 [Cytobacillus firmus]|nr:hypothetical protein [Cytobacillus firmus]
MTERSLERAATKGFTRSSVTQQNCKRFIIFYFTRKIAEIETLYTKFRQKHFSSKCITGILAVLQFPLSIY